MRAGWLALAAAALLLLSCCAASMGLLPCVYALPTWPRAPLAPTPPALQGLGRELSFGVREAASPDGHTFRVLDEEDSGTGARLAGAESSWPLRCLASAGPPENRPASAAGSTRSFSHRAPPSPRCLPRRAAHVGVRGGGGPGPLCALLHRPSGLPGDRPRRRLGHAQHRRESWGRSGGLHCGAACAGGGDARRGNERRPAPLTAACLPALLAAQAPTRPRCACSSCRRGRPWTAAPAMGASPTAAPPPTWRRCRRAEGGQAAYPHCSAACRPGPALAAHATALSPPTAVPLLPASPPWRPAGGGAEPGRHGAHTARQPGHARQGGGAGRHPGGPGRPRGALHTACWLHAVRGCGVP